MTQKIDKVDRDALERALEAARAESKGRRHQIDSMLADGRSYIEVARFAAYCVQGDVLGLMPWQQPPCHAHLASLNEPFDDPSGWRESAELLKRLLSLGLSKYEPDPIGAIAEAERSGKQRVAK